MNKERAAQLAEKKVIRKKDKVCEGWRSSQAGGRGGMSRVGVLWGVWGHVHVHVPWVSRVYGIYSVHVHVYGTWGTVCTCTCTCMYYTRTCIRIRYMYMGHYAYTCTLYSAPCTMYMYMHVYTV